MYRRSVICAIDFSQVTDEALHFAAEEALLRKATLDIVHVRMEQPGPMTEQLVERRSSVGSEEVRDRLNTLAVPLNVTDFRKHLLFGMPRENIVQLAHQLGSELVVVGSHSQPELGRWLLGSVAESLTKVSPCPVVVVRAQQWASRANHLRELSVGVEE